MLSTSFISSPSSHSPSSSHLFFSFTFCTNGFWSGQLSHVSFLYNINLSFPHLCSLYSVKQRAERASCNFTRWSFHRSKRGGLKHNVGVLKILQNMEAERALFFVSFIKF